MIAVVKDILQNNFKNCFEKQIRHRYINPLKDVA